jgi:hypothetical protein
VRAFSRVVLGDLARVESIERLPVRRPLPENRDPTQPRLRAFKNEHLEEPPIIMQRHAPLFVVITNVERIVTAPGTTSHSHDFNHEAVKNLVGETKNSFTLHFFMLLALGKRTISNGLELISHLPFRELVRIRDR